MMIRKRVFIVFMLLSLLLTFAAVAQETGRRLALVIGNSSYKGMKRLQNPANDARDVSRALRSLGFQVTSLIDAIHQEMDEAIYRFGAALKRGGVGLFYYSGHGAQYQGENYLIPVDRTIRSASELPYKSVSAGLIMGYMEEARNYLSMVILDACRGWLRKEQPFYRGVSEPCGNSGP